MTDDASTIDKQLRWRIQTDCGQRRIPAQLGIIDTEEKALRASYLLGTEALQSQKPYQRLGPVWLESIDAIQTGLRIGDLHLAAILAQPAAFFVCMLSGPQCALTQRTFPLIEAKFRQIFSEMLATKPSNFRQLEMLSECIFQFVAQLIPFPPTEELASHLLDELSQKGNSLNAICIRCMTGLHFHQDKSFRRDLTNQPECESTTKIVSQITELMQKEQYVEYYLNRQSDHDNFLSDALCECLDQLP
ncbi:hypothetical protein [Bremerella cremea]|nr:hypothetical protein [Bremerella cremea]